LLREVIDFDLYIFGWFAVVRTNHYLIKIFENYQLSKHFGLVYAHRDQFLMRCDEKFMFHRVGGVAG